MCKPRGAYSFASDVLSARSPHLGAANDDICAFAFNDAVAPVNISVGGYSAESSLACLRSSGKLAWAKMAAPFLHVHQLLHCSDTDEKSMLGACLHGNNPALIKVVH